MSFMGHDCSLSLFFKKILFVYLAVPGLSCSMWDLAPWPGIELQPLHWEHGVLAIDHQGSICTLLLKLTIPYRYPFPVRMHGSPLFSFIVKEYLIL